MVNINSLPDNYSEGGNKIINKGCVDFSNSRIIFRGTGATVVIEEGVNIRGCLFDLGFNANLSIGCDSQIRGSILIGVGSSAAIGKGVSVTNNLHMKIGEVTSVSIGDDCIVGSNVSFRTTDGHPIFDCRTRQRLNKSESISIGRHVWIADDCLIMKGSKIGNGSIVAARSIVTKGFEKNVLIAGSPGKVVKEHVTWERNPKDFTEEFYNLN